MVWLNRDSQWRPIDEQGDVIETRIPALEYGETYPDDESLLLAGRFGKSERRPAVSEWASQRLRK